MTGNVETFRRGATAGMPGSLAKRHLDSLVQAANVKASGVTSATQDDVGETNEEEDPDPTTCQDAHDMLQQQLADTCDNNPQDGIETNAVSPA